MGQKNMSFLWKQAHSRWCCLSLDKQLAFQGLKLQLSYIGNKQHLCEQPSGAEAQCRIIEKTSNRGVSSCPFLYMLEVVDKKMNRMGNKHERGNEIISLAEKAEWKILIIMEVRPQLKL